MSTGNPASGEDLHGDKTRLSIAFEFAGDHFEMLGSGIFGSQSAMVIAAKSRQGILRDFDASSFDGDRLGVVLQRMSCGIDKARINREPFTLDDFRLDRNFDPISEGSNPARMHHDGCRFEHLAWSGHDSGVANRKRSNLIAGCLIGLQQTIQRTDDDGTNKNCSNQQGT